MTLVNCVSDLIDRIQAENATMKAELAALRPLKAIAEAAIYEYRDSKYTVPFRTRKAISAYLGEEQ